MEVWQWKKLSFAWRSVCGLTYIHRCAQQLCSASSRTKPIGWSEKNKPLEDKNSWQSEEGSLRVSSVAHLPPHQLQALRHGPTNWLCACVRGEPTKGICGPVTLKSELVKQFRAGFAAVHVYGTGCSSNVDRLEGRTATRVRSSFVKIPGPIGWSHCRLVTRLPPSFHHPTIGGLLHGCWLVLPFYE